MSKEDMLKSSILKQFKSLRQFCLEQKIPYSTLMTALDRGIDGMAYGTVMRICDVLSLNPVDFTSVESDDKLSSKILENKVMSNYLKLNNIGKKRVMELMEDYSQLPKYTE